MKLCICEYFLAHVDLPIFLQNYKYNSPLKQVWFLINKEIVQQMASSTVSMYKHAITMIIICNNLSPC